MPLSPSKRIELIKYISVRLGPEDWALIDLTLKQFGLPRSDQWSSSRESYVIHMVEDASDATLTELATHCGLPSPEASTPSIEPQFWRKGMLRVFVSHLSSHRAEAAALQSNLYRFGISSFVAHNDIEPTAEWLLEIESALSTCDCLVALLHPGFHTSNWTDQELGFGMGRNVPIFSVQYGDAPYGFIGRFQAFAGKDKTPYALASELFAALLKHKQTDRRMAEVLVALFETSASFAAAKTWIGHIESLPFWGPSFTNRLQAAASNNSQVSGSWGVNQRVAALAEKWKAVPGRSAGSADFDDEIPFYIPWQVWALPQ